MPLCRQEFLGSSLEVSVIRLFRIQVLSSELVLWRDVKPFASNCTFTVVSKRWKCLVLQSADLLRMSSMFNSSSVIFPSMVGIYAAL